MTTTTASSFSSVDTSSSSSDGSSSSHSEQLATQEQRKQLHTILKEFSTMMVATYDKTGKHPRIHVRPLHVAKLEDDCSLVFVTARDTLNSKASERLEGNIIGQGMLRQVTMLGSFAVSDDRARLAEVWSKAYDVWFPKGSQDPNACLLIFTPRDAELWDASGLKGLKYLLESAKALLTKTTPDVSTEQHATLKMHRA